MNLAKTLAATLAALAAKARKPGVAVAVAALVCLTQPGMTQAGDTECSVFSLTSTNVKAAVDDSAADNRTVLALTGHHPHSSGAAQ